MTKSSCIQHPPSMIIVMIRQDYLALCQDAPDPHCAAALLNNMEYWTNIKLANSRQVEIENAIAANEGAPLLPDDGTWVYKTHEETQCDLLELFGRNKIVNNMAWLVSVGYLETRANPRYKWDKTKQYSLNLQTLQDAILNLPSFKTKRSNSAKLNDGKGKSKRTIPESTTETTTEENKKSLPPKGVSHYGHYLALLACWHYEPQSVTNITRTMFMGVAKQLSDATFPQEQIPSLYAYVARKAKDGRWSGWTVNALSKYIDEYRAQLPKPQKSTAPAIEDDPDFVGSFERKEQ